MKKPLILLLLLSGTLLFGQEKTGNVLVAAGNTIVNESGSLDWILGENLIDHEVLFGSNATPRALLLKSQKDFKAYPTITFDWVNIQTAREDINNVIVTVYDVTMKPLMISKLEGDLTPLSLKHLAPAMYFIVLTETNNTPLTTFKIIKN